MKVDINVIKNTDVSGKGGKEGLILSLFPGSVRKSSVLFDAVQDGQKFETKKQSDLQWFDIGKYANLSEENKAIHMVFVMHSKGSITQIATISLGKFIDILTNNSDYAEDGWTNECIEIASQWKVKYPRLQTKAPVKMKTFISQYRQHFQIEYEIH